MDQGGVEGVRETFPEAARSIFLTALTIAAEGPKLISRSPCTARGPSLRDRAGVQSNAFRVIYAVQLSG